MRKQASCLSKVMETGCCLLNFVVDVLLEEVKTFYDNYGKCDTT